MCGRFSLITDIDEIIARFYVDEVSEMNYTPRYNIAPSQSVTAIVHHHGKRRMGQLQWGLVPFWAKDKKIGYKMINARTESLHEKPSYKHLIGKKRCLIIADSFYEWKKLEDGSKIPVRIHLKDEKPFAFAGLWDRWVSQKGESITTCTILTTTPNKPMTDIHNRMPVILTEEGEQTWLDPEITSYSELSPLFAPHLDEEMGYYQVSTIVNSPQNDVPDCIQPLAQ
jgi:putative SOS response-associated peptidase YedK